MSPSNPNPIKALALLSTGMDSLIAAKLLKDLGIDVHGVTFYFRFDNLALDQASGEIQRLTEPLGIPVTAVDLSEDFLPVLLDPPHGYGSNFNPCIDCHLFMFRRAHAMMEEMGARFLITGEVMGQRPMSQTRQTLLHMNKVMDFRDIVLRPLSAKLLPETLPEREGWVDRDKLLDISGRGRKRQFELVEQLGIPHYHNPGGGCVLTNPQFGQRAKALLAHRPKSEVTVEALTLLRYGRHFWPNDHLHVVVGRHEADNLALEPFQQDRWVLEAVDVAGPLALAEEVRTPDDLAIAAALTVRYCGRRPTDPHAQLAVQWRFKGEEGVIHSSPAVEADLEAWRV